MIAQATKGREVNSTRVLVSAVMCSGVYTTVLSSEHVGRQNLHQVDFHAGVFRFELKRWEHPPTLLGGKLGIDSLCQDAAQS